MSIPKQAIVFVRLGGIACVLGALCFTTWLLAPTTHAASTDHPERDRDRCVSPNASYNELVHQFDYRTKAPLNVKELSVKQEGNVSIHDITYMVEGEVVPAYLVTPAGQGPFAGALFMHWLDNSPDANRSEFLAEAVTLAQKGTVSLLPQGLYPWTELPKNIKHDCAATIQQTIVLRRGLDLLVANKSVDHQRIAFIGHDYGAMYGSILAGIDKRLKAVALLAPTARFSNWNVPFFLDTLNPHQRLEYLVDTASLDPMTFIGYAAPTPVLFQFARQDKYVSLADLNNLVEVANQPYTVKLYNTDHSLTDGQSQQDRLAWLSSELSLH